MTVIDNEAWSAAKADAIANGIDWDALLLREQYARIGWDAGTTAAPEQGSVMDTHGVHYDVPESVYHAYPRTSAVSNSAIKDLELSPAHYITPEHRESSAFALGTALHCALLEPAKYAATYAVALDCDRRTKQGKEDSAAWLAANAGKIAISHDDAIKVAAMVDSVRSHPRAAALLAEGHAEVTLRWSDPVTGAECKARVDWLSPLAAVDVKSCQRGDLLDFAHSVGKWKYARQAAFYLGGLAALSTEPAPLPDTFAFFAVEKDAPHACRVYTISDASLQAAADKLQPLLSLYTACKAANSWPGPTHTIEELDLKPWQI